MVTTTKIIQFIIWGKETNKKEEMTCDRILKWLKYYSRWTNISLNRER